MTSSKLETIRERLLSFRKSKEVRGAALLSTLVGSIEKKSKNLKPVRDLTDEEVIAEIKSMIKGVRETMDALEGTDREEAKFNASQEWIILKNLLPSQMTDDEVKAFAARCVTDRGAKTVGEVMKYFKAEKTGLYDGKAASAAAKEAVEA